MLLTSPALLRAPADSWDYRFELWVLLMRVRVSPDHLIKETMHHHLVCLAAEDPLATLVWPLAASHEAILSLVARLRFGLRFFVLRSWRHFQVLVESVNKFVQRNDCLDLTPQNDCPCLVAALMRVRSDCEMCLSCFVGWQLDFFLLGPFFFEEFLLCLRLIS